MSSNRYLILDKYQCYNGSTIGFQNRTAAAQNLRYECTPIVYINDIVPLVDRTLHTIRCDIEGYFLYNFAHIWPEAEQAPSDIPEQQAEVVEERRELDDTDVDSESSSSTDWGADWDDCKVGWFAIVRYAFDNGHGIKVMKVDTVQDIEDDGKSGMEEQELYESFLGREWFCSHDTRTLTCLSKPWSYHHIRSRQTHHVYNYSVITYFEKFDRGNKLPISASDVVRNYARSNEIFAID